ncbi:hypothetical protein EDD86DRAFT_186150, partial [Gorgonomyces haynaldii]
ISAMLHSIISPALVAAATCNVIIHDNALTAQGLAKPFEVQGCDQANTDLTTFIQGAVLDPATDQVSVYNPLLVNKGTKPAVDPVVPKLPAGAVVALWFGSNNDQITLTGPGLKAANCVSGLKGSDFGQFASCNGEAFMKAAQNVKVPDLGTAKDGKPCLTTRDFALVDQDQSDNVNTQYLVLNGKLAQNTRANRNKLKGAKVLENGSDNALLVIMNNALGCKTFLASDLADEGNLVPALPLNELAAAKQQKAPIALVPLGDPMTLVNGKPSKEKTDLYRLQVNQSPVANGESTKDYCINYAEQSSLRFSGFQKFTQNVASPNPAVGNNLFTFLCGRFVAGFGADNLNCGQFGLKSPISVKTDKNGVATQCTIQAFNNGKQNNGGKNVTGQNNNQNRGNQNNTQVICQASLQDMLTQQSQLISLLAALEQQILAAASGNCQNTPSAGNQNIAGGQKNTKTTTAAKALATPCTNCYRYKRQM